MYAWVSTALSPSHRDYADTALGASSTPHSAPCIPPYPDALLSFLSNKQVIIAYTLGIAAMLMAFAAVPASMGWLQWATVFMIGFFLYGPQVKQGDFITCVDRVLLPALVPGRLAAAVGHRVRDWHLPLRPPRERFGVVYHNSHLKEHGRRGRQFSCSSCRSCRLQNLKR